MIGKLGSREALARKLLAEYLSKQLRISYKYAYSNYVSPKVVKTDIGMYWLLRAEEVINNISPSQLPDPMFAFPSLLEKS